MEDRYIKLQIIYEDLPDMIELGVSVRNEGWSALSEAYASPSGFANRATELAKWVESPTTPFELSAGADTGIGWLVMRFYTIDRAGHARCALKLATGRHPGNARPEETWRVEIEVVTELGLIQRFAGECIAMCMDRSRTATLECLFR